MEDQRSDSFYVFIFIMTLMVTHIGFHCKKYYSTLHLIVAAGFFGVFVSVGMPITIGSIVMYFRGTHGLGFAIRAMMYEETRDVGVVALVAWLMCFVQSVLGTSMIEDIIEIFLVGAAFAVITVPMQLIDAYFDRVEQSWADMGRS